MKVFLNSFRKLPLAMIACLIILGGALGGQLIASSLLSALKVAKQNSFPIKTMVPGFQVVEFKQDDRNIRMVMLNNYAKNITAYVLTTTRADTPGYILTQRKDFIIANREADRVIQPGTKTIFEGEIDGPAETHDLTIRAVVFDDLTSDGDQEYADQVLDKRHGRQLLLDEALPRLQKFTRAAIESGASGKGAFSAQLEETKEFLTSLASKKLMDASADTTFGYKAEADELRLSLEQIDKDFQSGDPQRVKFRTALFEKQFGNLRNRLQIRK
ncbi:MAG: hypothetical protein HOP19_10665 [Acidobacteria bacterium]|nr:hypothetical protein [Acidobacteriota bacterium]